MKNLPSAAGISIVLVLTGCGSGSGERDRQRAVRDDRGGSTLSRNGAATSGDPDAALESAEDTAPEPLTDQELEELTYMASELNSQMPLQITPDVTMLSVSHVGGNITYSGASNKSFAGPANRAALTRYVCNEQDAREMIEIGVTFTFIVTDGAGETRTDTVDRC